jgi:hypothetical protein
VRNQLRSALAKFFPGALPLLGDDPMELRDALAVLSLAANPEQGRRLCQSKIRANLARHGRQRNLELKAAQIQAQLRTPQLELSSPKVTSAYSDEVSYLVRTLLQVRSEVAQLEEQMTADFREHPDAEYSSVSQDSETSSAPWSWGSRATTPVWLTPAQSPRRGPADHLQPPLHLLQSSN